MFRKIHNVQNETITIYVDGMPLTAEPNESVASIVETKLCLVTRLRGVR